MVRLPTLPLTRTGQWRLFALVWIVIGVACVAAAGELARREARAAAARQAEVTAQLHASVLRSELEKHRSLPLVLARDPDLLALIARPDADQVDRLNHKLEELARQTRAAVIYALDAEGLTLAASNWREPTSFVGLNYRFRPYYSEAMRDGLADFFALGLVSGRPGLYLARRVDAADGRPLGVIVAKVEFDALERGWQASGEPVYVTDRDGVVIVTTMDDWRFHLTRPLSEDRRRRLAEDQTAGTTALADMPFAAARGDFIRVSEGVPADLYAHAAVDVADAGWTLHLLSAAGAAISQRIGAARALALLAVMLMAGLTGVLLRRRQRAAARTAEDEAARLDLERRIDERTQALREANSQLNHEIEERRRLEKSRQDLQDELIQANKLATLGQIAAGVAHEINQPVGAIRAHADSAGLYLERGDVGGAERVVGQIGPLTERIGAITDELRSFSRKTRSGVVAVGVDAAIDGALLLAGPRLRTAGVRLVRDPEAGGLMVRAERNRLEQVILNLIQNAIEALKDTPDPVLTLSVRGAARKVVVRVADNGPGVSPAMAEQLFTPFSSDKPNGLGLGLVISRDIVAGFGGDLSHEPCAPGAAFVITLVKAS